MVEAALVLCTINLTLTLILWHKTHWMVKMLFSIGQHLGWNDENGRPH